MFHEISERLVAWATTVAGEPIVTLGPPAAGTTARCIGLSLVDVIPHPVAQAADVSRLEVSLRYLATVSAETPVEAHRLLGLLTFAAMSRSDLAMDLERPSMQFWMAVGMAPQPCLSIRVKAWKTPGRLERRTADAGSTSCGFQRRATDARPSTRPMTSPVRPMTTSWRD